MRSEQAMNRDPWKAVERNRRDEKLGASKVTTYMLSYAKNNRNIKRWHVVAEVGVGR